MKLREEQALAKKCGLHRFHSDTPCRRCGGETRYTSSCSCVQCAREYNIKRNQEMDYE